MTQSLEALTRRTASMQGIRSIVHTMKTLSVINSAPYEHAVQAIEAYHATVLSGLQAVLGQLGPPDTRNRKFATHVIVAFGSDHGLCGNYNQSLAASLHSRIGPNAETYTLLCVGAQMAEALRDLHIQPHATLFPPASVDGIGRLATVILQQFDSVRNDHGGAEIEISLAYSTRDGAQGQRPEFAGLLPLAPAVIDELQAKPWASRSLPAFTMPMADLFQALLREHVFASLFRAAGEALVTENAARLALMQQAEQSVDDKLDLLTAESRSLRQNDITTELLDVITGFEALKKTSRKRA
jgi:F-type H+-transporting ATPase subunit gamma